MQGQGATGNGKWDIYALHKKSKAVVYYTVTLSIEVSPMGLRDSLNLYSALPLNSAPAGFEPSNIQHLPAGSRHAFVATKLIRLPLIYKPVQHSNDN